MNDLNMTELELEELFDEIDKFDSKPINNQPIKPQSASSFNTFKTINTNSDSWTGNNLNNNNTTFGTGGINIENRKELNSHNLNHPLAKILRMGSNKDNQNTTKYNKQSDEGLKNNFNEKNEVMLGKSDETLNDKKLIKNNTNSFGNKNQLAGTKFDNQFTQPNNNNESIKSKYIISNNKNNFNNSTFKPINNFITFNQKTTFQPKLNLNNNSNQKSVYIDEFDDDDCFIIDENMEKELDDLNNCNQVVPFNQENFNFLNLTKNNQQPIQSNMNKFSKVNDKAEPISIDDSFDLSDSDFQYIQEMEEQANKATNQPYQNNNQKQASIDQFINRSNDKIYRNNVGVVGSSTTIKNQVGTEGKIQLKLMDQFKLAPDSLGLRKGFTVEGHYKPPEKCYESENYVVPLSYCPEAVKTWIYPINYPVRDYQYNIVQRALHENTLVSLPTGLGKTFIAAVVMFNFYRWFPDLKVVFMAPTKPLVTQQVEACYNICGITQADSVELTGAQKPETRENLWASKRVFYITPQVLQNDLREGLVSASEFACVVVDEAHRSQKSYAYVGVVKQIFQSNPLFRILALSATPGTSIENVQSVVTNLNISRIEVRTEDAIDIQPYTYEKNVQKVIVSVGDRIEAMGTAFKKILVPYLDKLKNKSAFWCSDPDMISSWSLLEARTKYRSRTAGSDSYDSRIAEGDFALCISMMKQLELLQKYGFTTFSSKLNDWVKESAASSAKYRKNLLSNSAFIELLNKVDSIIKAPNYKSEYQSHPKLGHMMQYVAKHFQNEKELGNVDQKDGTKAMIFAQYRESVDEIIQALASLAPTVRAMGFVGQSSGKSGKGLKQKEQIEVISKFKKGGYNVLVCTSIGEEGLDIGEVDLIVCYDTSTSPIRMLQRMGRTGRRRKGQVVMLLTKGKEERSFNTSKTIHKHVIRAIESNKLNFFQHNPRMLPKGIIPRCVKRKIEMVPFKAPVKGYISRTKAEPDDTFLTSDEYDLFLAMFGGKKRVKIPLDKCTNVYALGDPIYSVRHSTRSETFLDILRRCKVAKEVPSKPITKRVTSAMIDSDLDDDFVSKPFIKKLKKKSNSTLSINTKKPKLANKLIKTPIESKMITSNVINQPSDDESNDEFADLVDFNISDAFQSNNQSDLKQQLKVRMQNLTKQIDSIQLAHPIDEKFSLNQLLDEAILCANHNDDNYNDDEMDLIDSSFNKIDNSCMEVEQSKNIIKEPIDLEVYSSEEKKLNKSWLCKSKLMLNKFRNLDKPKHNPTSIHQPDDSINEVLSSDVFNDISFSNPILSQNSNNFSQFNLNEKRIDTQIGFKQLKLRSKGSLDLNKRMDEPINPRLLKNKTNKETNQTINSKLNQSIPIPIISKATKKLKSSKFIKNDDANQNVEDAIDTKLGKQSNINSLKPVQNQIHINPRDIVKSKKPTKNSPINPRLLKSNNLYSQDTKFNEPINPRLIKQVINVEQKNQSIITPSSLPINPRDLKKNIQGIKNIIDAKSNLVINKISNVKSIQPSPPEGLKDTTQPTSTKRKPKSKSKRQFLELEAEVSDDGYNHTQETNSDTEANNLDLPNFIIPDQSQVISPTIRNVYRQSLLSQLDPKLGFKNNKKGRGIGKLKSIDVLAENRVYRYNQDNKKDDEEDEEDDSFIVGDDVIEMDEEDSDDNNEDKDSSMDNNLTQQLDNIFESD